ncbi:pilin [Patescibacteria group bacterium]|nr:pilin [Patescibacteria group bacterium]
MKKFFFLIFTFALFLPSSALATLDLRCYPKTDCIEHHVTKATAQGVAPPEESSMYRSAVGHPDVIAACGGSKTIFKSDGTRDAVVFCNPYGRAQTQISIGSESDFTDIADYFQYLYRYSIGVAGLLAVIMIIVAGFQWITSGGNTSTIGKARTRITRAIIGLLLVVGAYTILNTINPALVNLRLPQNWVLRPIGITPLWCDAIQGEAVRFAEVPAEGDPADPSLTVEQTDCGKSYYSTVGGEQTCTGRRCEGSRSWSGAQTCVQNMDGSEPSCVSGNIAGTIHSTNLIDVEGTLLSIGATFLGVEGYRFPWITDCSSDDILIIRICNNGTYEKASEDSSCEENDDHNTQSYSIRIPDSTIDSTGKCTSNLGVKGYAFILDLNEIKLVDDSSWGAILAGGVVAFAVTPSEEHIIDKNGLDIGDTNDQSNYDYDQEVCLLNLISEDRLIKPEDLKLGVNIDVDLTQIADIDEDEIDRNAAYGHFGYSWGACVEPSTTVTEEERRIIRDGLDQSGYDRTPGGGAGGFEPR